MAEPQSPPPSYASLYQGGASAPQGPPLPSGPLHPDGAAQAPHPGSQPLSIDPKGIAYPPNYGSNAYPQGPPVYPPHPGGHGIPHHMGGYPQPTGAAVTGQPSQSDPLLIPTAPSAPPIMSVPEAIQIQLQPQRQAATTTEPRNDIPVNPHAPAECDLGSSADHLVHVEPGQEYLQEEESESNSNTVMCWIIMSILAHIFFGVCIILLAIQVPLKQEYEAGREGRNSKSGHFAYNQPALITASVFLVVCYFVAILEGCASGTSDYLEGEDRYADFNSYLTNVRKQVPTLVLKAEAFHEGKEKIEWQNGVMISRRNSESIHKCVTQQETVAFPFSRCVDVSETTDSFERGQLYRVEYGKTFLFLDSATASEFSRRKQELIARVNDIDQDHSFETTLILPNMKKRSTVLINEQRNAPSYISFNFYNVLVCFLCSWPYRIFFQLKTRKKKLTFIKLIGI